MGGYRTIDGVAEHKPLSRCNMEEIAAYQRAIERRGHGHGPSGGVMFARTEEREQKEQARKLILRLCGGIEWPGRLTILTMPGLDWMFERQLLGYRETKWTTQMEHPARTRIYSIENDRAIYYGAIDKMPGRLTHNALLSVKSPPYFAQHSVKTLFVKRFYLADVDHLMHGRCEGDVRPGHPCDPRAPAAAGDHHALGLDVAATGADARDESVLDV